MAEIKLRADEARSMAQHVQQESSAAKDQVSKLKSYLNNLTDSFTGQTQIAFEAKFDDWARAANNMMDGLDGLGQFLRSAADTIERTDQEIAGKLS